MPNRTRLAAVLAAAAALAVAAPAHAALPKLVGTVGPGFTISLKQGGKNVTTVKRGKVTLVVADRSPLHNFHLVGPGVNVKTGVAATGTRTFTVTLKPGRYTFLCDPHPGSMKRTFRVS
jgi:plastocyanin